MRDRDVLTGCRQLRSLDVEVVTGAGGIAGVEVRIATTGHAMAEVNRLQQGCARSVAVLHLTG